MVRQWWKTFWGPSEREVLQEAIRGQNEATKALAEAATAQAKVFEQYLALIRPQRAPERREPPDQESRIREALVKETGDTALAHALMQELDLFS